MRRTLTRVSLFGVYVICIAVGWSVVTEADAEAPVEPEREVRREVQPETSAIETALMSVQMQNARLRQDNEFLRSNMRGDHVTDRIITIEESRKAYELLPPRLYMSVPSLQSGSQVIYFGKRMETLAVGQYVDLVHGNLNCYLILLESSLDRATFKFGCVPGDSRETEQAELTR